MVSNARDDFPDPLTPVTTVSAARGNATSMFLRLFWRAPWSRTNPASSSGRSGAGTARSYQTRGAARENPSGPEDVPNPQRLLTSSWRPSSFQPSSSPASLNHLPPVWIALLPGRGPVSVPDQAVDLTQQVRQVERLLEIQLHLEALR